MPNWFRRTVLSMMFTACTLPQPTSASTLTTPEIMASTACPDCLDYQVIGACLWLTCGLTGCHVATSLKVKHRLPDFVVMSYPETGNAPWKELAFMGAPNPMAKGGGHRSRGTVQGIDSPTLRFNNADVIGHPGAAVVFSMLSSFGFFIESRVTPLMPHYLSSLDPIGWRFDIPDRFTFDGLNPLNQSLGNFGDVTPRGGFVLQRHPFKASALAAFRALHLVTRANQSRVYQPFVLTSKAGFWPPGPVSATNSDTAFQMLLPKRQNDAKVWPEFDDTLMASDPYAKQMADDGQYAWNVWRRYKGCKRRGAKLLAHFGN